MRLLNPPNFLLPVFVITLVFGALTTFFTPQAAQAGTCTCEPPPGFFTTFPTFEAQPHMCEKYTISEAIGCTCDTSCNLYGIDNSCPSEYYSEYIVCWHAGVIFAAKQRCTRKVWLDRDSSICHKCLLGWTLSNGKCVQ